MTRLAWLAIAVLVVASCAGSGTPTAAAASPTSSSPAATSSADGLTDIGSGLRGPAGLAATVYATGLAQVSAFAFDSDDRLWAATAAYSDEGADAVYLIAPSGAAATKVIAGLHTVLGLLWIDDTLYVASKDRVDAYTGFDGASFAGQRTVVAFPAGVGEVNGLALAPTGRIVLGISSPCDACTPTLADSASIVSFLPDGSDLKVDVRDVRAPIALAYFPGSSDLFVTMNQRDDLGDATPGDWLAVAAAGQDWKSPACYGQAGADCSGVPAPTAVLDPHAAVSGLAIVTGQLGASVGTSALVAEWAKGTVRQVSLTAAGSGGYSGSVGPFLTGLTNPVPLILASDGTLFVGDWGTGTIYAIRASGGASASASPST